MCFLSMGYKVALRLEDCLPEATHIKKKTYSLAKIIASPFAHIWPACFQLGIKVKKRIFKIFSSTLKNSPQNTAMRTVTFQNILSPSPSSRKRTNTALGTDRAIATATQPSQGLMSRFPSYVSIAHSMANLCRQAFHEKFAAAHDKHHYQECVPCIEPYFVST